MGRKTSWNDFENTSLCLSWLAVSQNAVTGTDQDGEKFWKGIHCHFYRDETDSAEEADVDSLRDVDALRKRWSSVINKGVAKFCGFYSQVVAMKPSGYLENDLRQMALTMYSDWNAKQPNKITKFNVLECWLILKDYPKFQSGNPTVKLSRDENDENVEVSLGQRPAGAKQMKAEKRKDREPEEKEGLKMLKRIADLEERKLAMFAEYLEMKKAKHPTAPAVQPNAPSFTSEFNSSTASDTDCANIMESNGFLELL